MAGDQAVGPVGDQPVLVLGVRRRDDPARQRQELTGLYVTAAPEQMAEPPYAFTRIHLHYTVSGCALDPKKVERAIALSQDKYCSVAATIRGVTQLTYSFEVQNASGGGNPA